MTTFLSGTLNSANPGADIALLMHPALLTEGFTLVDTIAIGANTHRVYEMLAVNNSVGFKWYLDVMYPTTGAGSFYLRPFEDYSATTHLAKRGIVDVPNTSPFGAPYYALYQDNAHALETNWRLGEAIAPATSSWGYWISISSERVAFLSSANPTVVYYSGLFTPHPLYIAGAGGAHYPLIQCSINNIGSVSGQLSRFPRASAGGLSLYASSSLSGSGRVYGELPQIPFTSSWFFAGAVVSPIKLQSAGNFTTNSYWGYLIDIAIACTNGTVARGDTLEVGANTWVLATNAASGSTNYAVLFATEE